MSERREIVLVCDLCERDRTDGVDVETRVVVVNGMGTEAEVCDECWAGVLAAFSVFATKGRTLPTKTPKLRGIKSYPGTTWRFTSHALIRCGERNVDPLEVVKAIEDPTLVRPGRATDQEIRERGYLKAVVVPDRGIVVTVARRGEDDAESLSDVS
jgi:hypothetical protein